MDHMDHRDHKDHKDHRDHRDHKPPIIRGQRINQLSPAAQPSNPTKQLSSAAQLSSSAQQPSPSRIQKKLNWGGTQPIRNSKKWGSQVAMIHPKITELRGSVGIDASSEKVLPGFGSG